MRISELADASGVSVATLKFYIREGMLPRGTATSATSAVYDQTHVDRVRLIVALANVRELPIARVKQILALIDSPLPDPMMTVGLAVAALPPYVAPGEDYPRARATLEKLGWEYDPRIQGTAQLDRVIAAIEDSGLTWDDRRIAAYGEATLAIARHDLQAAPDVPPENMVAFSVLGTIMHEPAILALRRLAHLYVLTREQGRDAPPLPIGPGDALPA